jgi:hypothetical protein
MEEEMREAMFEGLIEKKYLLLRVEVSSREEVDEIFRWMYANKKPMKAKLLEIAWDREMVPKAVVEAVQKLKDALMECGL